MSKLPSIALAATLLSVGVPDAQAKQQCRGAAPSNPHGEWWSYRLIDGRKCWYQGKPMLSKALLEWPREVSARSVPKENVSATVTQNPGNPLDAQALMDAGVRALKDSETFEAKWRERVNLQ
ncbi:MAG TPA: hypothetical protein VIR82_06460 [Bradyrhizobium sp.]|jgi:hypothetical protein